MEYYLATKRNNILQRKLENPSDISQTQKDHYHPTPLYEASLAGKVTEAEGRPEITQDWGRRVGNYYLMVTFLFQVQKNSGNR